MIEVMSVLFGGSQLRDAFVFAALFLVLLLRPQGIFGQKLGRVG
jgi:branched-subunit amino acid ABC-type transport system permease component